MDSKLKVKRSPKRGHYDKETIYSILDNNFTCQVAFIHENKPIVIPTTYGRKGDQLFIHGSMASRMMKDLSAGIDLCVSVMEINAFVLAKSSFHHSLNYKSVITFGKAFLIKGDEEKMQALEIITDHIVPGRWAEARIPNAKELKGTMVLQISLEQSSAKIRSGGATDDPMDNDLNIWSGLVPIQRVLSPAIAEEERIEQPVSIKLLREKYGD